jgi:two-component system nitrate/nitrite response regulator NarL
MTRVLIADDHPIILSGAEAMLRGSAFEVVAKFSNGSEVLAAIDEIAPDIMILDVQMPSCTGLDVLRTLRRRGDERPIILLTAEIDQANMAEALALRVNGLILKERASESLMECLAAVSSGRQWIDESLLQQAREAPRGDDKAPLASLSPRELSVAQLVIQGMRNREIAASLGITEGTVKVHLYRVYEKLGVSSRTELLIHASRLTGPG